MSYKKEIAIIAIFCVLLTGCNLTKKTSYISSEPNKDGNYVYKNEDLKFSMVLPPEFIYFQTQRKNKENYTDLEILVPSSDKESHIGVAGYATPVVIRVINKKNFDELNNSNANVGFEDLERRGNKIYLIKFWNKAPNDWLSKWNDEMKNNIKNNIKLNGLW